MQPPFHRLEEFVSLSSDEKRLVMEMAANRRQFARAQTLRREGDPVTGVFFLIDGWISSSLMLRDGRRQIVKIHLAGDMLGLPSLALPSAGETLEALTDATVSHIPVTMLGSLIRTGSRLAISLFLSTQKERVALMQELSWLGATSALEKLVAFLLDLHDRLGAAGLVKDGRFDFPITQQHLGELLGLTAVHVNRTLKRLDATGAVERGKGWIRLRDVNDLHRYAPNVAPKFAGKEAWLRLGFTRDRD